MIDFDGYRPNVGIVICNDKGQVLWAKRYGQNSWQFPQGGINDNETPEQAMFRELFEEGDFDPLKVVEERGLIQISDDSALIEIVEEVLKNNPSSIEDYKNGKDRALGFLMGQCMKASKGKGNPQKFNELILERLV